MKRIRTIHKEEGETFLRLMCDVFDLDWHRAQDVFFAEPLFDLDRKWALFDGDEMLSILTTAPLIFGWGRAVGIAGVATRRDRQREGLATRLLDAVLEHGESAGEPVAMLFARDPRLYVCRGFERVDDVIRADIDMPEEPEGRILESEEVVPMYDAWAAAHPDRLRRDEVRWNYWRWNYRTPTALDGGYICHEPLTLREAVFDAPIRSLPLTAGTQWFGTETMARQLQLRLRAPRAELTFMCRHAPGVPQLFMTDQF